MSSNSSPHDVLIVGGGMAGLSAAIYLGRAMRDAAIIDQGNSMARWEPHVQNYLGFPEGIEGAELLERARKQARRYEVKLVQDEVREVKRDTANKKFLVQGQKGRYSSRRLLLATGIHHIPPDIPGVVECLGHSLFFCKDCDGYRVQGKRIAIYGANNETVCYALSMVLLSPMVAVLANAHPIHWDAQHAQWLAEYEIPVYPQRIIRFDQRDRQIESVTFEDRTCIEVEGLFTTRGDIYYNQLAKSLGARISSAGEIIVDADQQTSVEGLYAAGCVTPANCQMIIAAGQGATAAQAINRALLEEDLAGHRLRRLRDRQLRTEQTVPEVSMDLR
jgi:thioredoxin reductase (NADPH)